MIGTVQRIGAGRTAALAAQADRSNKEETKTMADNKKIWLRRTLRGIAERRGRRALKEKGTTSRIWDR
jgi:hypothetical protein